MLKIFDQLAWIPLQTVNPGAAEAEQRTAVYRDVNENQPCSGINFSTA